MPQKENLTEAKDSKTMPGAQAPSVFFLLVLVLSLPFLILGALVDVSKVIPINLPISALMAVCPLIAAIILTHRQSGRNGVKALLGRVFDYKKIKQKTWLLPAALIMPATLTASYFIMQATGQSIPLPNIAAMSVLVMIGVFFVGAICEEVGWTAYATDPTQKRFGILGAGVILGAMWALWHVIPYVQTHNAWDWIVWQCIVTVGLRVIMLWLYNKTEKSVFGAIVFHTSINVSAFTFPINGSYYSPMIIGTLVIAIVGLIVAVNGKTLLKRNFA